MSEIESLGGETVFEGSQFTVRVERFRHTDGEVVTRELVHRQGAAAIVAYDDEHVWLVRQPREALGRYTLELPAGMVGDADDADEEAETAARRELEEETGYRAGRMEDCGQFFSSPGMLSESFYLFRATGLTKVGDGGGTDSEDITVHRVPLDEVPAFVEERRRAGVGIDAKLLLLLGASIIGRG